MTTWLPIFIAVFCVLIAMRNSAQQKALKVALAAHGYLFVRSKTSNRRFDYQPATPLSQLPRWRRPSVTFQEVTFTDSNGGVVLCLAAVVQQSLSGEPAVYFDINLETLQPR